MGTLDESSISRAYVPLGKDTEGVHSKEVPVRPLPMVATVCRLPDLPSFKRIVTGPWALDHFKVMV